MLLFIKGIIIGIGKIVPGVSGAMLAIIFKVYERLLDSLTNFFNNWKENLKFLLIIGLGILLAIIFCSKIILYLLTNYKYLTMMFFIGLIIGGIYNFGKKIKYNYQNTILITIITIILFIISITNINNKYIINNNYLDLIIFFIGGFIEILASIIPGLSATSLLMMLGIYDKVLEMVSSLFNYSYVLNNLKIYLSYTLGMFVSLLANITLITYLLKKHQNTSYLIILSLSISSIIFLIYKTIKIPVTIIEFILGIILLIIGINLSTILDK